MKKLAILIQAHKNPSQLARLCNRLSNDQTDIFIHIDAKSKINDFIAACDNCCGRGSRVIFIRNRVDVLWGDFSQIQATLNSLQEISEATESYGHILFISGQDYPIAPISHIVDTFDTDQVSGFVLGAPLTHNSPTHRCYQYTYYNLRNRKLSYILNRSIRLLTIKKRKYPTELCYKGSSWWCISNDCMRYILDYCANNQSYIKFHKRTACGDEFFFHNIIAYSPFGSGHIKDESEFHFTYIDWSKALRNPKTLTTNDFDNIKASGRLFARKLDYDVDTELFDKIDTDLLIIK